METAERANPAQGYLSAIERVIVATRSGTANRSVYEPVGRNAARGVPGWMQLKRMNNQQSGAYCFAMDC